VTATSSDAAIVSALHVLAGPLLVRYGASSGCNTGFRRHIGAGRTSMRNANQRRQEFAAAQVTKRPATARGRLSGACPIDYTHQERRGIRIDDGRRVVRTTPRYIRRHAETLWPVAPGAVRRNMTFTPVPLYPSNFRFDGASRALFHEVAGAIYSRYFESGRRRSLKYCLLEGRGRHRGIDRHAIAVFAAALLARGSGDHVSCPRGTLSLARRIRCFTHQRFSGALRRPQRQPSRRSERIKVRSRRL
jgi:hypothetical protein